MIKQRQESVEIYDKAGRKELADQERGEIEIIRGYLPQQMSEAEAKAAINEVIKATGAQSIKDMGKVMAALKQGYAGKMDFGKASGTGEGAAGGVTTCRNAWCAVCAALSSSPRTSRRPGGSTRMSGACGRSNRARAPGFIAAPRRITTSSACIAAPDPHCCASYSMSPTGKRSTRFTAPSRHRVAAVSPSRHELSADGGGYGFGCRDPEGRNLAFVSGCADHADTEPQPDRPCRIAHVNLNSSDFDASFRFFTETLGFRQIDENAPLWFLHCASSEHSSIVLAKTGLPTLNHVAFELPDFDSVMRGMGRMKDNGYPIEWGPGRHGPGNNVFAYFCGPDEVPIEYTAEVLQVDDSYVPRGSELLEISARPIGPVGHHAAALRALLPRATAVRFHRRRLSPRRDLNRRADHVSRPASLSNARAGDQDARLFGTSTGRVPTHPQGCGLAATMR